MKIMGKQKKITVLFNYKEDNDLYYCTTTIKHGKTLLATATYGIKKMNIDSSLFKEETRKRSFLLTTFQLEDLITRTYLLNEYPNFWL